MKEILEKMKLVPRCEEKKILIQNEKKEILSLNEISKLKDFIESFLNTPYLFDFRSLIDDVIHNTILHLQNSLPHLNNLDLQGFFFF